MKDIVMCIKDRFAITEPGCEYLICTKEIKVNPEWRKKRIRNRKFKKKLNYWHRNGSFESRIILDTDFNLLDGYSSVRIAEIKGIDKVPAYFVARNRNFIDIKGGG